LAAKARTGHHPPSIVTQTVAELLAELVDYVVHDTRPGAFRDQAFRVGEYDVTIPKLATGFHMNIVEEDGATQIVSFRSLDDGRPAPIEVAGVNEGDYLIAINGVSVSTLRFNRVCELLGEVRAGSFVHLRLARAGSGPNSCSSFFFFFV
jgi:C-terminal processing protease CtpA/Prc